MPTSACNHIWNWNETISAVERVLKLFHNNYFGDIEHVGKCLQAAIIVRNDSEIISDKLPRAEMKLFQTDVDEGWDNFESILHVTTVEVQVTPVADRTSKGDASLTDVSNPRVYPLSTDVVIVVLVVLWVLIVYSCMKTQLSVSYSLLRQLSLAIPPWVGAMSTGQRAVDVLRLGSKGRYDLWVGGR